MPLSLSPPARKSLGFTLVELMVSMTIGMVILLGMVMMFVNNTKSQVELEKSNRQTESGRYAIQVLSDDIFNAGYYGEFDPSPLPDPAALPAPCSTSIATLRTALPLPVQGIDDSTSGAPCLTDAQTDSDVLVVRRAETCLLGVGNCEPESAGGAFFQASLCSNGNELGSADPTKYFSLELTVAELSRHKRDCTEVFAGTTADARRFITHIYYVAKNHIPGDNIPTLMRARLGGAGGLAFTVEAIAEGIESLQFEYGLDTVGNDGSPDSFTPVPLTPANWRNAVAVKVHLLSRNTQPSVSHTDTKVYKLGLTATGQPKIPVITDKKFKRHVFSTMVVIPNAAGRKAK